MRKSFFVRMRRRLRAKLWSRRAGAMEPVILIILCFFACGIMQLQYRSLYLDCFVSSIALLQRDLNRERVLSISDDMISEFNTEYDKTEDMKPVDALVTDIIMNNYGLSCGTAISGQNFEHIRNGLSAIPLYADLRDRIILLLDDMKCFPVEQRALEQRLISYGDSWMSERSYGGKRCHEGTDIMDNYNKRGELRVTSVSDGVVEKLGWLPQGGYRVGIRSNKGVYYYYAHLHSYAEGIYVGKKVGAGDVLGLMGDTGYSETEGTTGMFDVHLHFGIYLTEKMEEVSYNPYYLLRMIEDKYKAEK